MKIIKWIFLGPLILICLLVALLAMKMVFDHYYAEYWKGKTEDLCKKDAGVIVYEKITLPNNSHHIVQYNDRSDDFYIKIPYKKDVESGHVFYRTYSDELVKEGNLSIRRAVYKFIRIKDEKVISTKVSYSGAIHFILASGPHTFGCNKVPGYTGDLTGETFANVRRQ